jgi:hypothetical protein
MDINKNSRNLIIYEKKNNSSLVSEIDKKYSTWLKTDLPIYKIYYGDVYNPPFFNNIISLKNNTIEDVQKIWNMTLIGGCFMIENKYEGYFKDYIVKNNNLKNKNLENIKNIKSIKSDNKNKNSEKNNKIITVIKKTGFSYIFPKYRVVDFIIAGTMKGGTTAAITNFTKHPDISMVKEEIHYFDKKSNYQKGIEWYKKHFDYSKKMVGDKNHDVMYEYSCLELLQMINPQVKIILFLRNPIERAYSHWKMSRDLFKNDKSFEYSVMDEINNRWNENRLEKVSFWYHFVQRGLYYQQISEMLKYFPRDNIHISISEKIRNNMDEEYQKVFSFLNLPEFHDNFEEVFSSKSPDSIDPKSKIYKKLQKIYNKDVKNLEKLLGYKTGWW